MPELKTFMEPKFDKFTQKRAKYTQNFVKKYLSEKSKTVLDIGENNPVGNSFADLFGLELENTSGDLDYNFTAPVKNYDVVFCFEVLEHLMSPKYFLLELKKYISPETQIFISFPSRPKFLWTYQHFHEYDKKRFNYLMNACGYQICAIKKERIPQPLWRFFCGIRPFFRIFFNRNILVYAKQITKK
jgi:hypothetical protein